MWDAIKQSLGQIKTAIQALEVLDKKDKFVERRVETGYKSDNYIQINKGVGNGDKLALNEPPGSLISQ